jgi:hypothetical protein
MIYCFSYSVVVGRGEEGGWINILFLVIAGIVWAISSISKVKKEQTLNQRKTGQSHRTDIAKVRQNQGIVRQISQYYDIKQLKQKYINKFNQTKDIKPAQTALPEIIEPQINTVSEITSEPIQTNIAASSVLNEDSPVVLADSFLDLTDTDQLQKAIIYSEILSRPLSLRETHETNIEPLSH